MFIELPVRLSLLAKVSLMAKTPPRNFFAERSEAFALSEGLTNVNTTHEGLTNVNNTSEGLKNGASPAGS